MKKIFVAAMIAATVLGTFGCMQPKTEVATSYNNEQTMVVDKANKVITMQCEVNGTYFTTPTRHGIVFKDGGNGEKAVLRGLHSEKEFYQALIDLGATPGENLTLEDMKKGKTVEGDKINLTIEWPGQAPIPFANVIRCEKGDEKDFPYTMDLRFGGNISRANEKNTGCVVCLDSCAVGIVSDAAWPTGTVEGTKTAAFYGREDVLPKDGTKVTVKFTIEK